MLQERVVPQLSSERHSDCGSVVAYAAAVLGSAPVSTAMLESRRLRRARRGQPPAAHKGQDDAVRKTVVRNAHVVDRRENPVWALVVIWCCVCVCKKTRGNKYICRSSIWVTGCIGLRLSASEVRRRWVCGDTVDSAQVATDNLDVSGGHSPRSSQSRFKRRQDHLSPRA